MKKLVFAVALVASAFAAEASIGWSWWCDKSSAVDLSFGIGSERSKVSAFEWDLFYSASPVGGLQWTWIGVNNSSDATAQLAFVNLAEKSTVSVGFVNAAKKSVFDWGFLNFSDDSKFQLGFLNFNKKGFLPVFIFVNFDPSIFD